MNAPKEYYPMGYDKNFDDNFKSKVDLPSTNFHCGDQKHFPGLYGDPDLGCMVSIKSRNVAIMSRLFPCNLTTFECNNSLNHVLSPSRDTSACYSLYQLSSITQLLQAPRKFLSQVLDLECNFILYYFYHDDDKTMITFTNKALKASKALLY
jgi:hypothetical protein